MAWRWLIGGLVVVAVGCSSGGNDPTPISKEVADTRCSQAVDTLNEFSMAQNFLNQADMAQATDAMREIGAGVPGTDLSELVDDTRVAMTSMIDNQQSLDEAAPSFLEFRRSASALGLWCINHTSIDVSADLAPRFVRAG